MKGADRPSMRERPGHLQRLLGVGQVGVELGVGGDWRTARVVPATPEVSLRRCASSITQCPVNSVPRPSHASSVSHSRAWSTGRIGLAQGLSVEFEHRVAPDDHGIAGTAGDGSRLSLGQGDHLGGRVTGRKAALVHTAHHHLGVDAGVLEEAQTGRRARGEDQRAYSHGRERRWSAGGGRSHRPGGCAILVP
jgi:hypothetical protein